MTDVEYPLAQPVVIPYSKIVDKDADLHDEIEKAYGYDGLGLLVVDDVPQLPQLRQALLPLALKFAKLPDDVKERYSHPESNYSFGWSHGKEKLRRGRYDIFKVSGHFFPAPRLHYSCPAET